MAKLVWVLGIEIQVGGNTRLTRQGKTVVCLSWRKFYEINQENELVRDPDELRRTPTNSDELRRTPTNSDELCVKIRTFYEQNWVFWHLTHLMSKVSKVK